MLNKINQTLYRQNQTYLFMPVYPSQIYSLSMQSKKIFCAYHESEFLTNFCQQKQCLMPLCPSCIAEHTEEHFQEGKRPSYTSINEALNRAKQSCYCTIVTLQEYKKLNQDIYGYISTLEDSIHIQLMNKRNELFDIVTEIFNDYEVRLIRQINESYQEKNVYLLEETLNASKFIDEEISNLYQKISMLKGEDCLSSLITYYAVDQQNYREALQEFDDYFEKNRKAGKLQVSMIPEELEKITKNLCDSLLSIECIIENFQAKQQPTEETPTLKSKRYGFNKNNPNQPDKYSRQTIFEKDNDQTSKEQSLVVSRQKKIGGISRQERQDREISFNVQTQLNAKSLAQISKSGVSINENISRNRSVADSGLAQEQDKKRLFREFKKQV